ncbi:tetratricopeptide repeat-containing sensor histidine kinase [Flavobacterium sp. 25HG05S-40]|uniref:tetratricopeptide repeat-containing sensor histidine kinase n=1 Tax=Flavobacterium sp. 25HG05S-40 TaxID=3458682 RepID=UPI004044EC6A
MVSHRLFVVLFFVFGCCIGVQAQSEEENESLLHLLKNEKNVLKKINLNTKIASNYIANSQFEEALQQLKENLKLSKNQSIIELGTTYSTMSKAYIALAEIDSAFLFVNKALPLLKKKNDSNEIGKCYFYLAQIYQYKADFVKQADYSFKSIAIAEKVKDTSLLEYNNRNLAMLYLDQRNYPKALEKSLLSVKYARQINTPKRIGIALAALAETYNMMRDGEKAEKYFKMALNESRKAKHDLAIAWSLTNWANLKTNDDEEIQMRVEAQAIWDEISPDNIMSANNLGNLGTTYYEKALLLKPSDANRTGLLNKAEANLKKSIAISLNSDNLTNYLEFLRILSKVYGLKGDYRKAYECQSEFQQKNDSLFSQENKNAIAKLESEKEITIKNKELQLNKLQLESKEKQKWFYLLGIGFLVIVGGLLFYQNRNRKKINEKLQILNTELDEANNTKTRFLSILNHDLRGPVSNLIHFLHLQKNNPELLDAESKNRLQNKTILGAENLLTSMEDMLLWSKGQMQQFKPQLKKVSVNAIFEDTEKHFFSEEKVKIRFENPDNIEMNTDENYLKTIIRNLTGNAVKALKETENPTIIWKAWKGNHDIVITITDNGPGATKEQFRALYDDKEISGIKSGLGLHLIRDLAKAIDCEISVETKINSGTTITLTL